MSAQEMTAKFNVFITVTKVAGPFASKDEITEQLEEAIEAAVGSEQPEGMAGGEYEVTDVEVYRD